jgi:hypothetical protein
MGRVRSALTVITVAALAVALAAPAMAGKPSCATIKDGTITDSGGNPVTLGYDEFGYNYQSRMFNGTYDSSDRNIDGTYWGDTGDYVDDHLMMKWSSDWLSNKDCDGDNKLDRGSAEPYGTSQGWLTNHVVSVGDEAHTSYFVKIVWVGPAGDLWGQYTIVQEVWNDPANGETGLAVKVGAPGFGLNDHWTSN